ncbi:uncharacterized protein LOC144210937 isoform X2 [Stigmatopora nigra]
MNSSLAPFLLGAVYQKNRRLFPASLSKLRQLIEEKIQIVYSDITEDQQGVAFAEDSGGGLWKFAVLSKELTSHLQQLQTETEHELNNIQTQQLQIDNRLQQLTSELCVLREEKKQKLEEFTSVTTLQTSTLQLRTCQELQASIAECLVQSERLVFQKEALSALHNLLTQDLNRYQEEIQRLKSFTERTVKNRYTYYIIYYLSIFFYTVSVLYTFRSEEEGSTFIKRSSGQIMQEKNEIDDMEPETESTKQSNSLSEEEPTTPRAAPPNPKYQLFLNNDLKTNGLISKDADGRGGGGSPGENNGPILSRWETTRSGPNSFQGSMESIASRDLESDRTYFTEGPRVFNSPYSMNINASADYNPLYRTNDFKSASDLNLHTFISRSNSPVIMSGPALIPPRTRYTAYDSLSMLKRRNDIHNPVPSTHYSMRSTTLGGASRKDFIEELTKQLDNCQKRNQFLEAESVEMEKERNQIRFEMRGLLVNNEDLLRTNTQLSNEMKKMREQMIEMERTNQSMVETHRGMEIEVKQARDMMVEANTQGYAFGFLEQSLKNQIQDAEDNLEKQTLHSQSLAEKLWLAERQLEDLEVDKDSKSKKTSELSTTIHRLETELAEALQNSTQSTAELNLQQKLRQDAQLRMEELEESLLEKEQELQRHQALIIRLQGDVSGKLIDKEQTLEEEIQLRERLQLQCKQAERTVDDLQMELQTAIQAKDDLTKQLKQAQEKMIDLESDVEELHDSELRWAAKNKRAIDQTEQLQLKLIQEKDLNDQLETEKVIMERQYRELRLEIDELQSNRPSEDVISKTETRIKELENMLRTEERSKAGLMNTIGKLERRVNELSDQMEEEHRIATEQKDLMAQRIRSLKRQLNEAEEEASRRDAQLRHTQRELADERESNGRLQRQLLDQHLLTKRKETLTIRQTLDNLRLDLGVDDEDEQVPEPLEVKENKVPEQISKVTEV